MATEGSGRKKKAPRCSRCERSIHVPPGWDNGSATRRHYWRKHPEVMRPRPGKGSR